MAVALSVFTMVMSMNITILALPLIARDFAVTLREVSWVVIAFSLTVTALLLPMGRLSDLIGRKKTLLSGIILFIIGSMICYFADSFSMLILGRMVMGLGASMGQGVGTAIVVSVFPQKNVEKQSAPIPPQSPLEQPEDRFWQVYCFNFFHGRLFFWLLHSQQFLHFFGAS